MLTLLRRRCEQTAPNSKSRLRTHHTDALTFLADPPTQTYDLVVTNFFLDCLTQPEVKALATAIAPIITQNALWLISDFRIPSGPMRIPATFLVRILYFCFRVLTGLRATRLPDHASVLSSIGLTQIADHHSLAGILTTEVWRSASLGIPPVL